jgi:hypothetical protein
MTGKNPRRKVWRDNGLTLLFLTFFVLTLFGGQFLTGFRVHNADLKDHGQASLTILQYLLSDHFLEATMENWESEFLQMFAFVLATAWFFQRGSAESHDPDEKRDPAKPVRRNSPWPVRRGGWILKIYGHSLSLAFLLCFLGSFWLHACGGAGAYNQEVMEHGGGALVTPWEFMATSQFWFESFQNWQSEFLSVGAMVAFSIWLREKGSSQSKPVESPHAETGTG